MFEGYQPCVISSSSHAKNKKRQKKLCWGVVKHCNIALTLLARKQGNPLSFVLLTRAH